MPYYQEPYDNRQSTGTILEIMGRGSAARAAALRASGDAQARAIAASGAAYGNLGTDLAHIAAGVGNQIAEHYSPENQALAAQRQAAADEHTQALADAKAKKLRGAAVDRVMQASIITDPSTGMMTYDRAKLNNGLLQLGLPAEEQRTYLDLLDKSDTAVKTARGAQAEALKTIAELVDRTGNDATVFNNEVKRAIGNGIISERMAAPYIDAVNRDPAHVAAVTGALLGKKPALHNVGAGEAVIDANNPGAGPVYNAPEKPIAVAPGTSLVKPSTGETVLTTPERKSYESKSVLLNGKETLVGFDPKTNRYVLGDQDVTAQVRPMPPAAARVTVNTGVPGDWDKEGDAFLQTIPKEWRRTVEKIARYDEDPTKVASMRGGMRERLMQWVNQVNPAYDASQFSNRAPTRKAFTTGTQGQQINAINTAIGHIDQLTALADELQNGGFVPANRAYNAIRTMFGSDAVTNFDTLKDALAGEVSSVLSKGSATVSGIAEAKEKIHGANSPKQLAGYVKTLIPIMGSKLASLDYQYHQAMGENDTFSALSPETKEILQRHGVSLSGHDSINPEEGRADLVYDPKTRTFTKPKAASGGRGGA